MTNKNLHIRQATHDDIERLMEIFENAKSIMRSSGNIHQWNGNYPTTGTVRKDIDSGHCFVLSDEEDIIGTMALIPGPDPTYQTIEGQWNDDEPYYVIHRIAASAPGRNIAVTFLDKAFEYISGLGCHAIRIDTHRDNCIMKHVLTKYGFNLCGVIYLEDGAPRDAYQFTKKA